MTQPAKQEAVRHPLTTKCGCGRNGRYYVMQGGKEVLACNKYMRCPEAEQGKKE